MRNPASTMCALFAVLLLACAAPTRAFGQCSGEGIPYLPLDFGSVPINTTGPLVVGRGILEAGSEPLEIFSISVSGENAEDFSIVFDECSGVVLAPGTACSVGFTFTPHAAGPRTAVVLVCTSIGLLTSACSGTGVAPASGIIANLSWDAPGDAPLEPPSNLQAIIEVVGSATPPARHADVTRSKSESDPVTGYNVYMSGQPGIQPDPDTFYTSVPPTQTSVTVPVTSTGSFFVVTAVYGTQESGPSNETNAGLPGPVISKLRVKPSGISATGTGFTPSVQIFVDGIPFSRPAKVNTILTKIHQKGPLLTGQTLGAYKPSGTTIKIIITNDDGSVTRQQAVIP